MEITQFENDLSRIKNLTHSVKSMNTSNQNIISQLKVEEIENNKVSLNYARGIVDSTIFLQEISSRDLDIKYDLAVSHRIQNTIIIEGSYNSDYNKTNDNNIDYTRTGFFDHFSATNVGEAISRLSNIFQECQKTFSDNSKNK